MQDMVAKSRQASGDKNGSRRNPENRARGDVNGSRSRPEKLVRGDSHPNSKLTHADILLIASSRETEKVLGERFGVTHTTIWKIRNNVSWQHVTRPSK